MKLVTLLPMITLLLVSVPVRAAGGFFTLPVLDPSQTEALFKVLAADFAFRPLEPASNNGHWGLSIGATALGASTSTITSIIGAGTSNIYNADWSISAQTPFGLSLEAGLLPGASIQGTSFSRTGLGAKWTILDIPLCLALRGVVTKGSLAYSQPLNNGTVNVSYDSTISGAQLVISKPLTIFEPYAGYGILTHASSFAGSGTASLFNGNFPPGTASTSGSATAGWAQAGLQIKVGFMTFTGEYDTIFSVDTFAIKLGLKF